MQFLPERASLRPEIGEQHPAESASIARPPHVEAGQHQHDAEAGGDVDQAVADTAQKQRAVDVVGPVEPDVVLDGRVDGLRSMRVDLSRRPASMAAG